MSKGQLIAALQHLWESRPSLDPAALPDGELLERYIERRDETAFEVLLRRHGPMVWGVCRRLLRRDTDSEDAFQATFLVLVRKASSIRPRGMVGNWLYGVARKTSLKAAAMDKARQLKEREAGTMLRTTAPTDDRSQFEQIHEAIRSLPDKYRAPIVLCELEDRSIKETARHLGWPQGTVATRLRRGRALLAKRLSRRGIELPAAGASAAFGPGVAPAGMPRLLVPATLCVAQIFSAGTASGAIPANITTLTRTVLNMMLVKKLQYAVVIVLAAGLVGSGTALVGSAALDRAGRSAQEEKTPAATRQIGVHPDSGPKARPSEGFANAPGWKWLDAPRPVQRAGSFNMGEINGRGISVIFETGREGELRVFLAFHRNEVALDYRPIAFDAEHKRYPLKPMSGGAHHDVHLMGFRLDPRDLPTTDAKFIGFEFLNPEGRKVAANDAAERLRKLGVEVLPAAEIGRIYDFSLTTLDGKKIRAQDLRGKVVLIDCWATWCSPCMAKMPALKDLYAQYHKDGLEIVGVSFDHDAKRARKAIEKEGLAWPQVLAPTDEDERGKWSVAAGIESLPRLFVLDRDGILRSDCGPDHVKEEITKLMTRRP
jgi:RNA polymerase sigma factor (sigma-70 family)